MTVFDDVVNNLLLEYGRTMRISTSDYYDQLSDYLNQFGLVGKIYPFHHQMSLVHNLTVKTNAVNDITKTAFLNNFKDFKITGSDLT